MRAKALNGYSLKTKTVNQLILKDVKLSQHKTNFSEHAYSAEPILCKVTTDQHAQIVYAIISSTTYGGSVDNYACICYWHLTNI